jgi:hypothetical protein
MKYRRNTWGEWFKWNMNRGVYGMGLMVIALSFTQGLNGIIGVALMIVLIAAFTGLGLWARNFFQGIFNRGMGAE